MIQAEQLTKRFEERIALDALTTTISSGSIYGLVGSNGAGKSTFMRLLAGVYQPDGGTLMVDGVPVFEHPEVKDRIFFLPDELFFFQNATMKQMARFYAGQYGGWSEERFVKLCGAFPIQPNQRLSTFSKGMQRQAALVLALSCRPEVLLLDEAFDGLDPVIRNLTRRLLAEDVAERSCTVLIASHNLRELEDLCDQVGVLHAGRILFQREIDDLKLGFCKVQCAFADVPERSWFGELDLLQYEQRGSLVTLIVRGGREQVLAKLERGKPLLAEAIPLTLEEVFIYEMEAAGYDYNHVLD